MKIKLFIMFFLFSISNCSQSDNLIVPLAPGFKIDGLSASELSAEWWKWAMSSPDNINPVRDLSGKYCGVGQKGNIWFLAGSFGNTKIKRSCSLPSGKSIFFPVINMVYYLRREGMLYPCDEAKKDAAVNNDSAIELFVSINGSNIIDPKRYRAKTEKCFNALELRANSYNAYPSASDGYWIALSPLKKGKYNIKFGGKYNNTTSAYGLGIQDIEYELSVE
jgi:hypothetical protein